MRATDCIRVSFGAVVRYPLRTGMMLLATSIGVGAVLLLLILLGSGAYFLRRRVTT